MESATATAAVVEARLASLRTRFPERFTSESEERIQQRIERSIKLANAMKAYTLANSQQPFVSLVAFGSQSHE
jgi:ribose 1,5-bisphosphokinase PhnN